jgi:hypothetical protein
MQKSKKGRRVNRRGEEEKEDGEMVLTGITRNPVERRRKHQPLRCNASTEEGLTEIKVEDGGMETKKVYSSTKVVYGNITA